MLGIILEVLMGYFIENIALKTKTCVSFDPKRWMSYKLRLENFLNFFLENLENLNRDDREFSSQ